MKRMLTSISLLLPALLGLLVLQATPAQAAARNGVCDDGEFCYYYNSNQAGAVSDFTSSIPDLGATQPHCYDFKGTAPGHGQCTKNHAASVWNRSKTPVTVYYNSNYAGHAQTIQPGAKANLDTTLKNNNASHRYGTTTPPPSSQTAMSYALYQTGGGRITAGFDGYHSTSGRHEGIDFARGAGSRLYALTDGVVTNVSNGSGLTTLAVYQASTNKTVIYLHLSIATLRIGDHITRGQYIGTESSHGATAAHTHVEMRPGKQRYASKSVGDPHLDNPNPTSYWQSQGYKVA